MFSKLKKWFKERVAREHRRQFIAGQDWALNEMRTGRMSPEDVYDRVYDPIGGDTPFDKGARRAAFNYELEAVDPKEVVW